MNILVTGSSGQLGAAVVQELTRRDHKVIGIDIVPGIWTSQLISVADRSALFPLVKDVEAIIHIASLHQPHLTHFSRQAFIDINITGTLNLLEAAVEAQVRRFVYTSTTSLYGWALVPVEQAVWVTEDLAPCPRDIYDISKMTAEELCRTIASSEKMPIICLRVARFFAEAPELQAIYRLYRGVDLADVVAAHILAVTNQNVLFDIYNISAHSPFLREDLPTLWRDAPAVLQKRVPGITEIFARRNWRLPAQIDRVYVTEKAEQHLGYQPACGFYEFVQSLMQPETEK